MRYKAVSLSPSACQNLPAWLPLPSHAATTVTIFTDHAPFWNLALRAWQVAAGGFSLLAVARLLSPAEQGYYFTFASVLGLTVFFEMGLSVVLIQFASHELASLSFSQQGILVGDATARSRLAALAVMARRWYLVAAASFIVVASTVGWLFFSMRPDTGIAWQWPWLGCVLATGGMLGLTPYWAITEGCGRVAEVARWRLAQSILGNTALWIALSTGAGLGALPLLPTGYLVVALTWFISRHSAFLHDLFATPPQALLDWKREVWPMQWRIALSWMSGYLIFQLFVPILFYVSGPLVAGRMGMTLTVSSALTTVGMAWIASKSPRFGASIARRDWRHLDATFRSATIVSVMVTSALALAAVIGVLLLHRWGWSLGERVLDPLPFAITVATGVLNTVIFCQASYLRAHKQEPFLALSVAGGCVMLIVVALTGRFGTPLDLTIGYLLTTLFIGIGMGSRVFQRCRREWHEEPEAAPSPEAAIGH